MIISASRRTDIPAFYGRWFMNRLDAGFCEVANPFNARQWSRVALDPESVEAIVFWTRHPGSIVDYLPELDRRGYRYRFLYTVLDYPAALEPWSPSLSRRLDLFWRVSDHVGADRIDWRYDPIVLSEHTDGDYHREAFARIATRLSGQTKTVIVSLLDLYAKVRRRLNVLPGEFRPIEDARALESTRVLLADLESCARAEGMELQTCAGVLHSATGPLPEGACVDARKIAAITGHAPARKSRNQRNRCRCAESRDIGSYDSCLFGCAYCYACGSIGTARLNHARHVVTAPALISHV